MSPHKVPFSDGEDKPNGNATSQPDRDNAGTDIPKTESSRLQRYDDDEIQDLVAVGFGPASLAIAVALHDALETDRQALHTDRPKVRFLERQAHFAWHAGMLLPGAKMQITFIKDLATLRNPRSNFTFLNYLHEKGRLVQFTNLGTFLPQRIEYEDYMKWCASWFEDVVDYGQDVQSVAVGKRNSKTGAVEYFNVHSHDIESGRTVTMKAKNVVIAVGGKPSIPECLPSNHPRIIHSSQYATSLSDMSRSHFQPRSVAVIGAGQSAAEIFNNIPSHFPNAKTKMLLRGAALRPSDDSPFVNEIFDPDRVDDLYAQDPEIRRQALALDRGTNYGVVRLELLEHIYSNMYSYRIQFEDEQQWPQQILNYREVVAAQNVEIDGEPAIQLQIRNTSGSQCAHKKTKRETLTVDMVIVASGYRRDAHERILNNVRDLMPGGDSHAGRWNVRRDYGVEFEQGAVEPDAGIWLQGCNESTHGLSDTLLSILAVRGGEMVKSIFGNAHEGCDH